jgi:hypothetical protein
MTEKYDNETRAVMNYALEDLQQWMANAGADTTEASVLAWQQGYIAGVNRGVSIDSGTELEEID